MSLCLQKVTLGPRGFGPVDLAFGLGEIVVLCGRSGSGKSTLCELLAGIQEPTFGDITGDDTEVGYVAHDFESQLVGGTVTEELDIGEPGSEPAREFLGELLETLSPHLLTDPHSLSAGLQQCLLLVGLIRSGARFLILDESLSYLDPPTSRTFQATLKGLRRAGLGVLVVTHQHELLDIADRVVLMERGRVAFDGPRADFDGEMFGRAGFRHETRADSLLVNEAGEGAVDVAGLALGPGGALAVGGFSGAGSSRVLNSLYGLRTLKEWPTVGEAKKNCLLRQHVGPSFWRSSCGEELEASRGAFGEVPREVEAVVMDSIPAGWLSKAPWHLSHGQLRFFGAACLLLQSPRVLFLDHPFQGLDGALRESLRHCLRVYLRAEGRVILTTHVPEEMPRFGRQGIWLREGRVDWKGPTGGAEWEGFAKTLV